MNAAKKYLLLAALAALPLRAGLILDNGAPDSNSGNEFTNWVQAEDFTLGAGANIQALRFWAFSLGGTFDPTVTWQILSDAAGTPGSVLFSGNVAVTPVDEGALAYNGSEQLRFDIDTGGASLVAGTYWLALHNGPLSSTAGAGVYWQTTATNSTSTGVEDITPFDGVFDNNNGQEHAFQLFDTPFATTASPEPASLTLFAGGLGALWLARRRRA